MLQSGESDCIHTTLDPLIAAYRARYSLTDIVVLDYHHIVQTFGKEVVIDLSNSTGRRQGGLTVGSKAGECACLGAVVLLRVESI